MTNGSTNGRSWTDRLPPLLLLVAGLGLIILRTQSTDVAEMLTGLAGVLVGSAITLEAVKARK